MTHIEALRATLKTSNEPITVREWFKRTLALRNETGDPDSIARRCGFEPDDIVRRGDNFFEDSQRPDAAH